MIDIKKRILDHRQPISTALKMMNELGVDLTLFIINDDEQLIGTITDGDVRRGLLSGLGINDIVVLFMNTNFQFIHKKNYSVKEISKAKELGIKILPVLDEQNHIIRLINFSFHKSYLPVSAVLMAGGDGIRLRPLTEKTPKPLLKIGTKAIIEYGIDWLIHYGIDDIIISINYLGNKIVEKFGDGSNKNISISYIQEKNKLGTIGSVGLIENIKHDNILVLNSDLLTNIDLEEFFILHEEKNADMSIACIPYNVNIPYAVMDMDHENVLSLKEKPTYTYHANAGIYLIRKEHLNRIPKNQFLDATDLIYDLIADKKKIIYYPVLGYWLDIGKMEDYIKAQQDIKYLKF